MFNKLILTIITDFVKYCDGFSVMGFLQEKKEEIPAIHSLPEFEQVNFLHFQEILADTYGIILSYTPLISILKATALNHCGRYD